MAAMVIDGLKVVISTLESTITYSQVPVGDDVAVSSGPLALQHSHIPKASTKQRTKLPPSTFTQPVKDHVPTGTLG